MLGERPRLRARVSENGHVEREQAIEAMWVASERRHAAERRRENITAWIHQHEGQIARHRRTLKDLIAGHNDEIVRLRRELENGQEESA